MTKRITKPILERARKNLLAEVEIYDQYLRGEIYGYGIYDEDGGDIDSCWGFFGDPKDCLIPEAKRAIDYHIEGHNPFLPGFATA
jgi:hypothetical protein